MATPLRASHFSSIHTKGEQPSIFDILSQESLMKALKPAMGHLMKYLAIKYPHLFLSAHRCFDEVYLLFDLFLQNQYLQKYGASFAENFYAMKRIVQHKGTMPLTYWERIRSLLTLVLSPYMYEKLDKLHEQWVDTVKYVRNEENNYRFFFRRMFVLIWPWCKTIMSTITIILQLGYIINRTSVHSLSLLLAGVRLERLTPKDLESFESVPMHLQQSGIINRLWRFLLSLPGLFNRLFGYGLFFVQFIDFIYNSDFGAEIVKKNMSWKIPPAPHKLLTENSVQLLDTNKCPLCLQKRVNDTALSVSGYVFCYKCIEIYLKEYNTCPVTGLPASSQQLIRLYIQ